jgi:excisionase family DNA binding protein
MENNTAGRDLTVPRSTDRRLRPMQRISHAETDKPKDELANSTGRFEAEPSVRRLFAVAGQETAVCSFEPLIDSAAAAHLLKIHRKTLERLALRGAVPAHKIGKFWRFRASELDEWLRSRVNSGRQPCCTTTF